MRFALIEIKTLLYILLTNFVFSATKDKITKTNVFVACESTLTVIGANGSAVRLHGRTLWGNAEKGASCL